MKITKAAIAEMVKDEVKKHLKEQADHSTSNSKIAKKVMSVIMKMDPKHSKHVLEGLPRFLAQKAEDAVGEISDRVASELMFRDSDTDHGPSLAYAIDNVPPDLFIQWMTDFGREVKDIKRTFPLK